MIDTAAPATISDALENQFGLADRIVDEASLANSVHRFKEQGIVLPTFAQLADPATFDHDAVVGDADRLTNGNVLIADGSLALTADTPVSAQIVEVDPSADGIYEVTARAT